MAAGLALGEPVPQQPMVVTATRQEQPLADTMASATVITRDDIVESGARDLMSLLRLQAGIDISRTGGPGQQTSLFLRGTNSNHVLVLIDGVRANAVQSGAFGWEQLPLDEVERIEIVRGPGAAFYGSDAIGGVIQIFTRRPDGPFVRARGGSYDTLDVSAGIGGGERASWHLTAGHEHTGGFSAQDPSGFSYDPDDDGYENTNLSAGFTLPVGGRGTLHGTALHTDGRVQFDQGVTDTTEQTAGLGWRGAGARVQLGFNGERQETPVFDSGFRARRWSLDAQLARPLGDGHWLVGVNLRHEHGESFGLSSGTVAYGDDRDNAGLFAGISESMGAWRAELTARGDHNSEFGDHATGKLALSRRFGDARAWASFGTAFRGPNLNEQFSPGFGGQFAGNPDLDPETSASTELGIEWRPAPGQSLDLNAYHTRIEDLIAFAGENFRAINVNRATIDGLETRYEWLGENWRGGAALTLQDTEDQSTGRSLLRRPDRKLAVTLRRQLGDAADAGVEVVRVGERLDVGGGLDAYTLVNLSGNWRLSRSWSLDARVENLLDEDYELAAGFNTAGLSAYVGFTWRP